MNMKKKPLEFATFALWLLLPLLTTVTQVSMKLGGHDYMTMALGWEWLANVLTSPLILLAFFCDGLSFFLWLHILSRHDISSAFPITSLCYITISACGWLFLHEPVMLSQVVGIVMIMGGVALIAGNRPQPPI